MNEEARIEYINNQDIPFLFNLLGSNSWLEDDEETRDNMREQLVGEYLEEKE